MNARDLATDLANRFDLRKRVRSWGGDCPSCSYHSAFSIKVPRKGDRPLLYCANGCTQEQLNQEAERVLGTDWTPSPPTDDAAVEKARGAKAAAASRLWNGSGPFTETDPPGLYLHRRGLAHRIGCAALRHRPDCWHPENVRRHAMMAAVTDVNGALLGVHRTFLSRDGQKADLDPVKASLGPIWGGAIRLDPVAAELVIAEGIETAASAALLLGLPAWAAISAGNMARGLVLPPEVRAVVIAADPDSAGRDAAQNAAARWQGEGRRVRIAMPNVAGQDFNDLLMTRPAGAPAEVAHG